MEALANRLSWKNVERWFASAEGKRFLTCIIVTFAWGLIAHAYAFLNPTFSHDSMSFVDNALETKTKIAAGRIFVPLYHQLFRGLIATPWLVGILTMVWIGLACYFVCVLFSIRSFPMIAITSGIMTVNLTVITQVGTYMHDCDGNFLGLMLAVLSVYVWRKNNCGVRFLLGAIPAAVALGIYQSNISSVIVLIIILSMLDLLEGKTSKTVVCNGLRAIAMLVAAGVIYMFAMKVCTLITGMSQSADNYNSLSNIYKIKDVSVVERIWKTYIRSGLQFMLNKPIAVLPKIMLQGINIVFLLCGGAAAASVLLVKKIKLQNKILFTMLGILIPFGANIAYFLSGDNHMLMLYAIWFIYLLVLLLFRWKIQITDRLKPILRWKRIRNVAAAALVLILFSNIQVSNAVYVKKDLERSVSLSIMTRVMDDVEKTENYEPGKTKLFLCGLHERVKEKEGFKQLTRITGADFRNQLTNPDSIQNYFKYILGMPIAYVDRKELKMLENSPEVQSMPVYPAEGSIAFVDDVLVVKLS